MSKKIEVPTAFGMLVAESSGDPDYPGIHICLNSGKEEQQLALVECTPGMPIEGAYALRALIWADDSYDYSHELTMLEDGPKGGVACV